MIIGSYRRFGVVAVTTALLVSGCGGDGGDGGDDAADTEAPAETATPETTEPVDDDTEPAAETELVTFTTVCGRLEASGDIDTTVDLTTAVEAHYGGPDNDILILLLSEDGDASLNLTVPIGTTTAETNADDVYMNFIITDSEGTQHPFLLTEGGECTITIDEAGPDGVSGSFECDGVSSTGEEPVTIDVTGTFEASP